MHWSSSLRARPFHPRLFSRITIREDDFSKRRRPILIAFFSWGTFRDCLPPSPSLYPMTLGKSPNTRRIKEGLHRKTRTKCWWDWRIFYFFNLLAQTQHISYHIVRKCRKCIITLTCINRLLGRHRLYGSFSFTGYASFSHYVEILCSNLIECIANSDPKTKTLRMTHFCRHTWEGAREGWKGERK